jgi:aminopeptidase N
VALDAQSLAFVREKLERIDDVLLRQLLWQSLWNMVRDQQLTSTDYLALVREKIVTEPDRELVEVTLGYVAAALGSYVPDARRRDEFHAMFEVAWRMLQRAAPGDEQITWARALVNWAVVEDDLRRIARLADGEVSVPGFTLDQELRWTVAIKWTAYGIPGAAARLAEEERRDPSDRGKRALLRAETARPTAEAKAAAWERFHGEGYGSLHYTSAAMSGFNWTHQRELLQPYVEAFFTSAPRVFRTSEAHEFASAYFGNLFPGYRVERETLARSERLLGELGEDQPILARMLREANDDIARAIACRAFAEA